MSSSLVLVLLLGAYTTDSNESKTKKKKIVSTPNQNITRPRKLHRKVTNTT